MGLSGFGAMMESYHMLQQKPKTVTEFKNAIEMHYSLPYRRRPFTALWKTTTGDCRHVSANDGHFEHI